MPSLRGPQDVARLGETGGVRRLYDVWARARGGRPAPARADIDPLDMPELLPFVWIMDVVQEPLDFRLRLMGTELVEALGGDFTGAAFREMFKGPEAEEIFAEYRSVVETWRPHFVRRTGIWAGRAHVAYSRLALPLSDDGSRVTMLIGVTSPDQAYYEG